jgi:hypothetical protein
VHDLEVGDPNAFADFFGWIKDREEGKKKELKIGDRTSSTIETSLTFEPPEKIILLGDILELWAAQLLRVQSERLLAYSVINSCPLKLLI